MNPLVNYFRNLQEIHSSQAAEAQLFVGWVSALRNIIGRWVSCFNRSAKAHGRSPTLYLEK